jgi:hypothetical protein
MKGILMEVKQAGASTSTAQPGDAKMAWGVAAAVILLVACIPVFYFNRINPPTETMVVKVVSVNYDEKEARVSQIGDVKLDYGAFYGLVEGECSRITVEGFITKTVVAASTADCANSLG